MCKACIEGDNLDTPHCDNCRIEYEEDGSILGVHLCNQCLYEAQLKAIFGTGSFERYKKEEKNV